MHFIFIPSFGHNIVNVYKTYDVSFGDRIKIFRAVIGNAKDFAIIDKSVSAPYSFTFAQFSIFRDPLFDRFELFPFIKEEIGQMPRVV